ncbi:UNVERIFIED_CONTAM: NEDD8-activating enzyme E1 regulatory subunit AXR1 [Sesamum indicum]
MKGRSENFGESHFSFLTFSSLLLGSLPMWGLFPFWDQEGLNIYIDCRNSVVCLNILTFCVISGFIALTSLTDGISILCCSTAVGFYILLRAVDRFAANYNSFPGQFDGEMDEEISRLKTTAVSLLADLGCNGSNLTEDLTNEMCRYGAAELHAVVAIIGGIASQEVIKVGFSF